MEVDDGEFERDIEPCHHAARTSIAKVNHGRPMGLRRTEFTDEHVDLGMIDFHDFERMARTVFAHDRREARAGGLRSFPVLQRASAHPCRA